MPDLKVAHRRSELGAPFRVTEPVPDLAGAFPVKTKASRGHLDTLNKEDDHKLERAALMSSYI